MDVQIEVEVMTSTAVLVMPMAFTVEMCTYRIISPSVVASTSSVLSIGGNSISAVPAPHTLIKESEVPSLHPIGVG